MSLPRNNTSSIASGESNASVPSEQTTSKPTTCCATLTGAGRSAIAVIELWGESATDCLQRFFRPGRPHPIQIGQIRYGLWSTRQSTGADCIAGESIIVVRTAPQRYEIQCHGGQAAVRRIVDDLSREGVASAAPSLASGLPLTGPVSAADSLGQRLAAEACEVLSQCTTARTAAIALDQVRGALGRWRENCIETLTAGFRDAQQIASESAEIAAVGRFGVRLARPFDVVLAGPPNVGKSSLINAMVGYERSITMDLAGTTRDVLDAETVFDGWPLRLRDTAGLHSSTHQIEQQGIERALQAIATADLVIQVSEPGLQKDRRVSDAVAHLDHSVTVLDVVNKADLSSGEPLAASENQLTTVATTGEGIEALLLAITHVIACDAPESGAPVPINQRQRDWVALIATMGDAPSAMLETLIRGPNPV